jgi:replicative DNA helicase
MLCGHEDRETFDRTRAILRRDSFFTADHQVIFEVICEMDDAGTPIDSVLLRAELDRRGLLNEIGGGAYIAQLLNSIPSPAHGPHYAATVREKATLRGLESMAYEVLRRVRDPAKGTDAAAALSREFLEKLSDITAEGAAAMFTSLADATAERLERKQRGEDSLIPTGIPSLDDVATGIGGFPLGKFTLVGGRPGSGKSLFCKQAALNVAHANVPVGIVTVEETTDKVAENMLSNESGVENRAISFGNLSPEQWRELALAQERLQWVPFWVNDRAVKLADVEEAVTTAATRHKCKLVVVDYLQLVDGSTGEKGETEVREITRVSQALKRLAKRLNIAVVAACQLNRGNESQGIRQPAMRDLRGSGSLEQDGDVIILLHREDYYRHSEPGYQCTGQLLAIVAKFKNAGPAVIPLKFSGATQSISDWPEQGDPFPRQPGAGRATAIVVR